MSDCIYNPDSEKLGCRMKLACDYYLIPWQLKWVQTQRTECFTPSACFAQDGTVFWECSENMFDSIYRYLYHVCMWTGQCSLALQGWDENVGRSFTLHVPLTCSFQASQDQPGHSEVVSYPLHSSKKRDTKTSWVECVYRITIRTNIL